MFLYKIKKEKLFIKNLTYKTSINSEKTILQKSIFIWT